jgi:hypothetical protein
VTELVQMSRKAWPVKAIKADTEARVVRIATESPLEIIVAVTLTSATAVNCFALLVNAFRRVYRNARGVELDRARIDEEIARLRASQSQSELEREITRSEMLRSEAAADVETINPGDFQLSLDEMEATIQDG